jgi:2-polyprenyl-3-methyl-5-hydroxy-6-metoxy-1,4-benzoquinol methylase
MSTKAFPLDLAQVSYSYVERANPAIQHLLAKHTLSMHPKARVLDVGCGCGANAQAIRERSPGAWVLGVEPNERAAELARDLCNDVFQGTTDEWQKSGPHDTPFDAVVLSDVLEHVPDPIAFLRDLLAIGVLRDALWIISVPNYAVWYNRLATVLGRQRYAWSGLWDRTHLRFYTRRSVRDLLEYCGMAIVDGACTPSLVQSAAPLLRKRFEREVREGDHLALTKSPMYKIYQSLVEPVESQVCELWPELLGFQIVHAARIR